MRVLEKQETPLCTVEELERLSSEGGRFELVRGELRAMSPAGGEHGRTTRRFEHPLSAYIYEHDLGECFAAETGFIVARNPDTILAPDWAFVARERLPRPLPRGFVPIVPDLVLETRSPEDRQRAVRTKVEEWLAAGVRAVLELDPIRRKLTLYRPGSAPVVLTGEDTLTLDDILPGFAVPLRRLLPSG